jgi:hypothetical protein
MADEEVKMSDSEKKKEDWMNSKWRPMMGWMYMGVCIFDFVIAPVLWSLVQAVFHGGVNVQWQPLTLQGAGLFHISMGAVLGLAAYGRTQEKLAGANNGGLGAGTTYTPPAPISGGFSNGNTTASTTGFASGPATPSAPATGGFGVPSSSFGATASPAPSSFGGSGFGSAPATGFGSTPAVNASGKKVIPTFDQPAI